MSYFSFALTEILKKNVLSQMDLARKISMTGSQVSRYSRGESQPEIDSLQKIVEQFDPTDRAQLLAAYLRDRLPVVMRTNVHINIKEAVISVIIKSGASEKSALSEFREALHYLVSQGSISKSIRNAVITFANALNLEIPAARPEENT